MTEPVDPESGEPKPVEQAPVEPTRRRLLSLLASTGLAALFSGPGLAPGFGAPRDQGIGGTGAAPPVDDTDRGIGGTGVIGIIKKFGSIYVNDLRIGYPSDAEVRIDGRPAALDDLKLGQVVRVEALGADDALSTKRINVTHEVVGPVDSRADKQLVVLGQTVSTEDLPPRRFALGETVAVSGLRRNDGTIVASLIEPRPGAVSRVSGPVTRVPGGGLRVGALSLDGVDPALIGHRATLVGRIQNGAFVVTHGESDASPFPRSVRRLSIESYVEQRDGALALGSGLVVGGAAAGFAAGRSVRAILTTSVGRDGRLTLDNLRAGGRTYQGPGGHGGGRGGPGGGGHGPGGGRGDAGGGHGGGGHGGGGHGGGGRGPGGEHGGRGGGHEGRGGGGRDGRGGGGHEGRGGGHEGGHGGRHGGFGGGREGGPGGGREHAGFGGPHEGFGGPHGGFGGPHGGFGGPHGGFGGGFRGGPGFGGRGFGGRGFGGGGFRGGGRGFGGFRGGGFRGGGRGRR